MIKTYAKHISLLLIIVSLIGFQHLFGQLEENISGEEVSGLIEETGEDLSYATGELIIKFKPSKINMKTSGGKNMFNIFTANEDLEKITTIEGSNIAVMQIEGEETVMEKIDELKSDPTIEYVQPNFLYKIEMADPNDTDFANLWGLKNTAQTVNGTAGTSGADIQRTQAMDIFSGNGNPATTGTIVAVIDNGVNYNHIDLINNMWSGVNCLSYTGGTLGGCLYGYDFYNEDINPFPNGSDLHGSHIAGVLGASMGNTAGVVGVNPNARIMAIRAGNGEDIYTDDIIQGINFAKYNGAKIINASWGGGTTSCNAVFDQLLYETIRDFPGLFIAAAGNGLAGVGYEHLSGYFAAPSDYGVTTSCWTGLNNIIGVAATDQNDLLTSWSDFGTGSIHVGAPGKNIYSTVLANGYAYEDGTSMATPYVAGLASLAWSYKPNLSYTEIKDIILGSGDSLASLSGKTVSGKRINAYNVLLALQATDTTAPDATINYSITGWTNQDVLATITGFTETVTGLNTTGHLFTGNGSFIFTFSDLLGNTGSKTATVTGIDTVAPTITLTNNAAQFTGVSKQISGTFSDTSGLTGVYANGTLGTVNGNWTATLTGLAGGVTNLTITGSDLAGNSTTITGYIVRITDMPSTVSSTISGTTVIITFATDLTATGYIIYGTSSLNTTKIGISTTGHSFTITGLTNDLTYSYRTYGINNGYTGTYSATGTFIIDTIAPSISTGAITNTTSQTPTFTFTVSESGALSRSGSCTSSTTTATSGSNSIALGSLSNASYSTCYVRVTDQVNNTGSRYNLPTFTVNYTAPPAGGGGGGGGGGGTPLCASTDIVCTNGLYQVKTGANCQGGSVGLVCMKTSTLTGAANTTGGNAPGNISYSSFTSELNSAYLYAYNIGITTMPTIQNADMEGNLIRSHMAKMMVNYAIKVMELEPDTSKTCTFNDIANQSTEMKGYIKLACQLGLMGVNIESFSPTAKVTRAQFGTTLSRTLWGDTYNGGAVYYTDHLNALKENDIMNKIDTPNSLEIRGYVMLMLMRAD